MRGPWPRVFLITLTQKFAGEIKLSTLEMRRPALLIFATPELHSVRVVLDFSGLRVKTQLAVYLPGNVGKLQHGDSDISNGDWSVEFLSLANARDKVGKVQVGHGVAAGEVGRRSRLPRLELTRLISLQVVDLIAIAIDQHRPGRSHDGRPAIAVVILHAVATLALPRDHLVVVVEARHQRVVELPVILELVSSACRRNPMRKVDAKCPAADIDLMGAVVERLARSPRLEHAPVVRLPVALLCQSRTS